MPSDRRRNRRTVWVLVGVIGCMVALDIAAVPLYRLFCAATGYDGTTRRAGSAPTDQVADKIITVRFNAEIGPNLDWDFHPKQISVKVHPGQSATIDYEAVNHGDTSVTGTATYNVTPDKVGAYFYKIQCFCFTKQHLTPGEHAVLPVTFFVDPGITSDPDTRDVDTITLSYTMFRAETQGPAASAASPETRQIAAAPR